MRLIDADKLKEHDFGDDYYVIKSEIDTEPTVQAIPIPDNATNGDVIKAIFPQIIVNNIDDMSKVYTSIPFAPLKYAGANIDAVKDWWNAPYKAESEEI